VGSFIESSDESGGWPPQGLPALLDRDHVHANLNEVHARLTREFSDEQLALDAVQIVLLEALAASEEYASSRRAQPPPMSDFSRFKRERDWWLYLLKAANNRYRRLAGERARDERRLREGASLPTDSAEEIEAMWPKIERAMPALSLKERAVLVLMREGLSQDQIRRVMRLTASRISQLKRAALDRVRR